MATLKSFENNEVVYENQEKGILFSVDRETSKIISQYFKKYKGKKDKPKELVDGFVFLFDEEQESLKVDYSKKVSFEIKNLKKFDAS